MKSLSVLFFVVVFFLFWGKTIAQQTDESDVYVDVARRNMKVMDRFFEANRMKRADGPPVTNDTSRFERNATDDVISRPTRNATDEGHKHSMRRQPDLSSVNFTRITRNATDNDKEDAIRVVRNPSKNDTHTHMSSVRTTRQIGNSDSDLIQRQTGKGEVPNNFTRNLRWAFLPPVNVANDSNETN